MTRLPLFDRLDAPRAARSPTSAAAADTIGPHLQQLQARVMDFIQNCGDQGATDEEIQQGLAMRPDTARARRCELRDARLVFDSGKTRETTAGRSATVWIVAAAGPGAIAAAGEARPSQPASPPAMAPGRAQARLPDFCPRCKSRAFRDYPIHGGRSRRRDCAGSGCRLTWGFPVWNPAPRIATKGSISREMEIGEG